MNPETVCLIEGLIRFDLSPEQASNVLKKQHGIYISHERIYQHVWADKRGQISNRTCIELCPKIVEEKSRLGDWEIDTVIGKNHKGALVTIVDRKSKFTLIKKVKSKHAEGVTTATIELLTPH